jgi:hypothetical protein
VCETTSQSCGTGWYRANSGQEARDHIEREWGGMNGQFSDETGRWTYSLPDQEEVATCRPATLAELLEFRDAVYERWQRSLGVCEDTAGDDRFEEAEMDRKALEKYYRQLAAEYEAKAK